MYKGDAMFWGEQKQEARLLAFFKQALSPGETAMTLRNSFKVELIMVEQESDGVHVVYECENTGKAFCTWGAKECGLSVDAVIDPGNGVLEEFTWPTQDDSSPKQVKQTDAIQQMQLESQRIWEENKKPQQVRTSAPAGTDPAIQSMLENAKKEGIAEGRFQILKNVMQCCDTLDEMLRLTGVEQQEFITLFERFKNSGR